MSKLTQLDIREMRSANSRRGYARIRSDKSGVMDKKQWACWQKLNGLGLTYLEGLPEVDGMTLTDAGRRELRKIGRG